MTAENPISFSRQFKPPGMAGLTVAPSNVDQQQPEQDVPPDAGGYTRGPLSNLPPPSPTPAPQSLSTLANGGTNHQEAWMSGMSAPQTFQQTFGAPAETDSPPGAQDWANGPLANPPRPTPAPKLNTDLLKRFSWSTGLGY